MSWSATLEFDEGKYTVQANTVNDVTENQEQYDAAVAAAADIVASGAMGPATDTYSVGISAHANPNHESVGGQRDFISINIYHVEKKVQVPEIKEPQPVTQAEIDAQLEAIKALEADNA